MDITVQFNFKGKAGHAIAIVDYKAQPFLIFAILEGEELIKKFGDDITIQTDCEQVLELDADNELNTLKLAIFEAIKNTKEFAEIKAKYPTAKAWPGIPNSI